MIKNGTSGSVRSLESLETVLSPIKSAHFLREFYCRTPLYTRGDPDRFSSLLSWDGLNRATTLQRKHRPPRKGRKNTSTATIFKQH